MTEPYKHSIDELVTRYKFEPKLRDLYVEGLRDWFLFDWFFRHTKSGNVAIYQVEESVGVSRDLVDPLNVSGNKGRIIALFNELAKNLPAEARNVLGLVDKDDADLVETPKPRFVLFTDYSCLECYAVSSKALSKFCGVYLGKKISSERLSELLDILREVFLLRVSKRVLYHKAHWIDEFTRCCTATGGKILFDREGFIERLANASGGMLDRDKLRATFIELPNGTSGDVRHFINGHDLIRMLSWFAHQLGVPLDICDRAPLQRALFASIELEDLNGMPLFQRLVQWVQG